MLPEYRRRELLRYFERHHAANVIEVPANSGASEAAVRRDLHELQRRGERQRAHGGAVAPDVGTAFRSVGVAVLLADRTEFDKLGLARVAAPTAFQRCITDSGVTTESLERYRAAAVKAVAKGMRA